MNHEYDNDEYAERFNSAEKERYSFYLPSPLVKEVHELWRTERETVPWISKGEFVGRLLRKGIKAVQEESE